MGARAELCCSIQEFELLSFHRFLLNKLKKREKKDKLRSQAQSQLCALASMTTVFA
jgi:hypothetical protein